MVSSFPDLKGNNCADPGRDRLLGSIRIAYADQCWGLKIGRQQRRDHGGGVTG